MKALLEAARPKQWVKNLFVAAPVIFAKHLGDGVAVTRALFAVAIFCALSSAVYLWNDVVDIDRDRAHPRKRFRPIASGRLSPAAAQTAATLFALLALGAALVLDRWCAAAAASYLALNIGYSLWWKQLAYLDVLCIATGFLLRVVAGGFAVHIDSSPYLLLCTGLLASFLALGKRAHELIQLRERSEAKDIASPTEQGAIVADEAQRPTLKGYHLPTLRAAMFLFLAATFSAYVAYTRAPHTVTFFQTTRMIWTAPFCLFGLARFLWLAIYRRRADSPTEEMLRDLPFVLNLILWGMVTLLIIYFRGSIPRWR